jgi:hypothetical protein
VGNLSFVRNFRGALEPSSNPGTRRASPKFDSAVEDSIALASTNGRSSFRGDLFILWRTTLETSEKANNIIRGSPASDITAAPGICVFPFPAAAKASGWLPAVVSPGDAVLIEAFGTESPLSSDLLLQHWSLHLVRSPLYASSRSGISVPGSIAAIAGYGKRAFLGKDHGFWVCIVASLLGGPAGGVPYDLALARAHTLQIRLSVYHEVMCCSCAMQPKYYFESWPVSWSFLGERTCEIDRKMRMHCCFCVSCAMDRIGVGDKL